MSLSDMHAGCEAGWEGVKHAGVSVTVSVVVSVSVSVSECGFVCGC